MVSDAYDEVSARNGLTRQQARLLFVLHARPSNMLGLGAHLHLSKSTMTGVVARMEAAGWVHRTVDSRDRRNALVTPTREIGTLGGLLSRVLESADELLPPE